MKNKSLISIHDYTKEDYFKVLEWAEIFQKNPKEYQNLLNGKVVATLFFEPSTRTRLSFESAVQRMGGRIIGFSDPGSSSVQKGESLKDTILTVAQYSDLIVMRHPIEGSARWASEVSPVPIVNAGDGANQHPTQCLLDLFTIKETQHRLDNLTLTFVGDLKYGRTVHSLIQAMANFNPTINLVSPESLKLPNEYKLMLKKHNIKYHEYNDLSGVLKDSDIVYVTRVQRERFSDPIEYEKVKNAYVLDASMLVDTKPNLKVLHPLPRVNEISVDVDDTDKAYYFQQALNGVYTRMAIISLILGLKN
ncbi:MAG: aspartate carbamoyltransferase [Bacteroidales bacterium]|nr:aspartate carbamoyltransferase [Bacteroidales bacterium]